MTAKNRNSAPERRGPEAVGSIVKRYRKRDGQYTYGLRIRAYGERYWVPLGTEREGWNDVRAADRRDEITALIRRGAWRPPNTFELDPREKNPGFHEFASDWLKRYRRTVDRIHRRHRRVHAQPPPAAVPAHLPARRDRLRRAVGVRRAQARAKRGDRGSARSRRHAPGRSGRPRRALSPRTINMTLDLTARIFNDAVKRGLLPSNPGERPRPPTEGDAAKGELPRGGRAARADRGGSRRSTSRSRRRRSRAPSWRGRCAAMAGPGRRSPPSSASPRPQPSGSPGGTTETGTRALAGRSSRRSAAPAFATARCAS